MVTHDYTFFTPASSSSRSIGNHVEVPNPNFLLTSASISRLSSDAGASLRVQITSVQANSSRSSSSHYTRSDIDIVPPVFTHNITVSILYSKFNVNDSQFELWQGHYKACMHLSTSAKHARMRVQWSIVVCICTSCWLAGAPLLSKEAVLTLFMCFLNHTDIASTSVWAMILIQD